METAAGQNDLTLWWRAVPDGVEVTRVETGDRNVILPETVRGLPVTVLGHHAFSPDQPAPEGTPLRLACGGGTPESDTRRIETVTLPPTVRRVGDYAFLGCAALRELRVTEPVDSWGGSVFMNCRSLRRFFVRVRDSRAESLSFFADELPVELDVAVEYPDGGTARLIFPEYRESYEENSPAHHFDFHLYGPGYPYHHDWQQFHLRHAEPCSHRGPPSLGRGDRKSAEGRSPEYCRNGYFRVLRGYDGYVRIDRQSH